MGTIFGAKSVKTKIFAIVLFSTFIITAALGYLSYYFSKRRLVYMLGESMKGIAATAANSLRTDDILLILKNSDKIRKRYMAIKDMSYAAVYDKTDAGERPDEAFSGAVLSYVKYADLLSNIKTVNNIDGPINLYVKDGNRLKLVLTSDNVMMIGVQYKMRPEAQAAFSAKSAQSTSPYKDINGTWLSAYAPVYSPPTQIITSPMTTAIQVVIEINRKIDSYINRLRQELGTILLVCFIGFLSTALLSYHLVGRLTGAIRKLDDTATELERENYDVEIDIKRDDEIGHLAQTFEKLKLSIRDKINELRTSLAREKKAHLESIIALTNVIGLRDPYTKQHLYRVEKYALLIAKKMRLSKSDVEKLRYSCHLHDIGKVGLDAALLQKVKLSREDFDELKKHTEKGAKIIGGIQFLQEVQEVILHHQEHYDGTGYPDGLKGDKIPLLARIVAVADAFDAMTTDRPYKPKIGFREALNSIAKNSGTQFDPKVCDAFLKYKNEIEDIAKKHFKALPV
jgi:putative nucleotidyltransferase with HDIG domain